tara:strand:+ start:333 stop:929 length:597 start_codon:yes stop_codon:yes gene_type:complete
MKATHSLRLLLCIALSHISATTLASSSGFTLHHTVINPACLALINGSLSDRPFITSIDLDRCQTANATFAGQGKGVAYQRQDGSQYQYRVIGQTKTGLFVIATTLRSSGSGVFQNVVVIRLKQQQRHTWDSTTRSFASTPYTSLTYVANLGGGDRFSGAYQQLSVVGNHLIGRKANNNNPANQATHPQQRIDIDLSAL